MAARFGAKSAHFRGPSSACRRPRTSPTVFSFGLTTGFGLQVRAVEFWNLSSFTASLKASQGLLKRRPLSGSSTASSSTAADRMRSMTFSSVRSLEHTSRVIEQCASFPIASSICGRIADSCPLVTTLTFEPTACTNMCFVRRRRPVPKPMRSIPKSTSSSWAARHSRISSTELVPPATRVRSFGSGFTSTQFQAPKGSATACSASRPRSKSCVDWWSGMTTHLSLCARLVIETREGLLPMPWSESWARSLKV
mmetsp:Transcript_72402/g.204666  ORF Transcript_72402/g.204666 Transcript_72402/m.204666 type:complete len:253 (+) Transcript_72402:278-1036(+)